MGSVIQLRHWASGHVPAASGVELVVRGPVGVATLREGDVRARNKGVDRGDDLA
jgi:hypothetical protein